MSRSVSRSRIQTWHPGAEIGDHRIERHLARGGMGDIWLATVRGARGFEREVVLKTVRPDLASDVRYTQMLVHEACLLARLEHPNIVGVYDLRRADDGYYIVMEYVRGRTLAQLLGRLRRRRRRLPAWLSVSLMASCCDGLQYVHDSVDARGRPLAMLHRDMSPSNVMVSRSGRVVILDFGIAIAADSARMTSAGALKGKVAYMAPERILGLQADRRSDVYSMGVMLYELLAGRRPFDGENLPVLRRIVDGQVPPLAERAPWVPAELQRCVSRALALHVEDRYPDVRQLAVDLRRYLGRRGMNPSPHDRAELLEEVFAGPVARPSTTSEGSDVTIAVNESDILLEADVHEAPTMQIACSTGDVTRLRARQGGSSQVASTRPVPTAELVSLSGAG